MISGKIKFKARVISRGRRPRLIKFAETLIIPDITKTKFKCCFFFIYCFEENNDKRIIAAIRESRCHSYFAVRELDISLGIKSCIARQPTDYSLLCRYRLVNNL